MDFASASRALPEPITSASNPLIKRIRGLGSRTGRKKTGLFLAEGESVVREALAACCADIEELVISSSFDRLDNLLTNLPENSSCPPIKVVDEKLFKEVSGTDTPLGIIALVKLPQNNDMAVLGSKNALITVACAISDPGNLGTIIRSSLAFGADAVFLTRGSVDPYNPKVVRAAAGALFALPVIEDVDGLELLNQAKAAGVQSVSLAASGDRTLKEVDFKRASLLMVGNEAHGIEPALLAKSDLVASIPIAAESESLNAAVAHSIALYEASDQRRKIQSS
ncbi:MAG: RNA methyltransferase [Cyanobacteria bacterium HKST-UBA01]|nr:RNA methyltransferase [Cyanobacteria bacterium HKST-UBA01]